MANNNAENWTQFLSSIENVSANHSTQTIITTKSKIKCLAEQFANQLLQDMGGTIMITGEEAVLNRYEQLVLSENQTATPITKGKGSLVKPQTWPKSKDETKGNIDEITRKLTCCQLFPATFDSTKIQNANAVFPEVLQTYTNEHVKETSSQSANAIIPEVSQTDTKEHVKETPVQNDDAIMPEVPQIDTNENVNDISLRSMKTPRYIEESVKKIPLVSGDIDIKRIRRTEKDIDTSCSSWDVSSIVKYFNFEECVIDIKLPNKLPPCKDDILEMVQKDICLRLDTVKSIDLTATEGTPESTFLEQLQSIAITEAGSRLVLDPVLVFLCSGLGLHFEVEKNIKCSFLPNCTFDYCIRKGKHIIGCIEAKSLTGFSKKSVAQAVIELMILQTTAIATELTETQNVDISELPVFAIVTDGHRFIYIELNGSSLGFEHEVVKEKGKEIKKLKIRKVTKEGDWKEILQLITFLVQGDKKRE